MATFFDTSAQADLNLLHSSIRSHSELDNVVDLVEWKLLDHYKQRKGLGVANNADFFRYESGADPDNEIQVRLVGYDQDTPSNSKADLQEQLKYTIAKAVSWVLRNYDVTQGATSIQQGKRSVDYGVSVPDWNQMPSGIQGLLKNFDARVASYGI